MIRKFILTFLFFASILAAAKEQSPGSEKAITEASKLLRAGQVRKAEAGFLELLKTALEKGDDYYAARSRIGLSACYVVTHDYRDAIENGESALRYGLKSNNRDIAVRAALNVSSVYRRMRDFPAAAQTMRNLNPILPEIIDPTLRTQLYLHAGTYSARNGDWQRAEPMFFAGIDTALSTGDLDSAATGWNQLGYMRLQHNDLKEAETALTEAFRLRRLLGNRNLGSSYMYLAILRLAQQDGRSALNLLNRAVEIASVAEITVPTYPLYYWRAKSKMAIADVEGGLADFDRAVQQATLWRHEVLPTDGFRISAEVGLNKIYDEYVHAGMGSLAAKANPALARRMFEVSEEHRSAAFRELLRTGNQLPAVYWEALTNYRTALAAALTSENTGATNNARLQLARIETSLGLAAAEDSSANVQDIQKRLGPDEALISFHTGQDKSYVWAITRDSFEAKTLDGLQTISPIAKRYRKSIENGPVDTDASTRLYAMLFGSMTPVIEQKRDWMLSLDQGLYDIPYAALGPARSPLIVQHSLRTIPGAALLNRPGSPFESTDFVGAGDAIYNSADPRWSGPRNSGTSQFARLVGTREEVMAVSKAWKADSKPALLFGTSFNRASLEQAFRVEPAIVHIAAHVVTGVSDASNVMIGIGLAKDGQAEFLTPQDIAARRARLGLVTINGCASGGGADLPGAGLVGLTRAWLLGGATAVAATYWPVDDGRGELFARMYGDIALAGNAITASTSARALQAAQVAAFRSAGPQSAPGYWAAVFLAGKQ